MRRTGHVVYRPICSDCRACQPLRVDVNRFEPSKSQRKLWRKNRSAFSVELNRPVADEEHVALYNRYQRMWHESEEAVLDIATYQEAFVWAPVETLELSWRDAAGKLVGVGILDVLPAGFSSVYFYWDPDYADYRLGTLSIMEEIELTQKYGKDMYYMGFFIKQSPKMAYKAQFQGAQIWNGQGWVPVDARDRTDKVFLKVLQEAEAGARAADRQNFPFHRAVKVFTQSR